MTACFLFRWGGERNLTFHLILTKWGLNGGSHTRHTFSRQKFTEVQDGERCFYDKMNISKVSIFQLSGPFHIFSPLFGSKNVFFSPQSFRELVVPPSTKVQAELSIRKPHEPRVTFRSSRKNTGKWMQMMQIDANCRSHRCHRHDTATVFACSKIGSAKSSYAWLQTVQGEWWTRVNPGESGWTWWSWMCIFCIFMYFSNGSVRACFAESLRKDFLGREVDVWSVLQQLNQRRAVVVSWPKQSFISWNSWWKKSLV